MSIYQGYTFGSTELCTNTKLHNLIANASIALGTNELSSGFLSSLTTMSGVIPSLNIHSYSNVATNSSIPSISGKSLLKLNWATYGSIASISGAQVGQVFTLIAGQASFPVILDSGSFALSADWIPNSSYDNLTLVWDGSSFIEIGRVNN